MWAYEYGRCTLWYRWRSARRYADVRANRKRRALTEAEQEHDRSKAAKRLSSVTAATVHQTGPDDLSDRLQQLKDAYNKNLITKEEYDRVRQAILDSMDD